MTLAVEELPVPLEKKDRLRSRITKLANSHWHVTESELEHVFGNLLWGDKLLSNLLTFVAARPDTTFAQACALFYVERSHRRNGTSKERGRGVSSNPSWQPLDIKQAQSRPVLEPTTSTQDPSDVEVEVSCSRHSFSMLDCSLLDAVTAADYTRGGTRSASTHRQRLRRDTVLESTVFSPPTSAHAIFAHASFAHTIFAHRILLQ